MAQRNTRDTRREGRRDMADMVDELAALEQMSVSELQRKYRELFGEPSASRHKAHLRKKVAWRIQELAEGGLSQRAVERRDELSAILPDGWRRRLQNPTSVEQGEAAIEKKPVGRRRDARLPEPGSTLERIYKGKMHTVTVLEMGFEYAGEHYTSLSKVAHAIAGTAWNGFSFFGLAKRGPERAAVDE